jgi:protein-tyrosine phosphatase
VTSDDLGQHPANHAQTVARKHGFDISSHISRLVKRGDFEQFDVIVSLEGWVQSELERMRPQGSKSIVCEFVRGKNISNPWAAPLSAFEKMYEQIEAGMGPFIEKYIPKQYRQ